MSTGAGGPRSKSHGRRRHYYMRYIVEKDTRQLVEGVNVEVSEPMDMLALLLHNKVVTDRLRQSLRYGASRRNLVIAKGWGMLKTATGLEIATEFS